MLYSKSQLLGEITQLHVTREPGCFWDIEKFFLFSSHEVSFISEAWHRALNVRVLYEQLKEMNECFIFMAGSIYHQMALLYHEEMHTCVKSVGS